MASGIDEIRINFISPEKLAEIPGIPERWSPILISLRNKAGNINAETLHEICGLGAKDLPWVDFSINPDLPNYNTVPTRYDTKLDGNGRLLEANIYYQLPDTDISLMEEGEGNNVLISRNLEKNSETKNQPFENFGDFPGDYGGARPREPVNATNTEAVSREPITTPAASIRKLRELNLRADSVLRERVDGRIQNFVTNHPPPNSGGYHDRARSVSAQNNEKRSVKFPSTLPKKALDYSDLDSDVGRSQFDQRCQSSPLSSPYLKPSAPRGLTPNQSQAPPPPSVNECGSNPYRAYNMYPQYNVAPYFDPNMPMVGPPFWPNQGYGPYNAAMNCGYYGPRYPPPGRQYPQYPDPYPILANDNGPRMPHPNQGNLGGQRPDHENYQARYPRDDYHRPRNYREHNMRDEYRHTQRDVHHIITSASKCLKFDGSGDWLAFKQRFLRYVNDFGLNDRDSLSCLIYSLSGDASILYATLDDGTGNLTLEGLLMGLEEAYGDIGVKELHLATFNVSEQKPDESLQKWAERVRQLASKAFRDEPEKGKKHTIEKFCMGLIERPVGRAVLLHDNPQTLMEALRLVQRHLSIDLIYPVGSSKRQQSRVRFYGSEVCDDSLSSHAIRAIQSSESTQQTAQTTRLSRQRSPSPRPSFQNQNRNFNSNSSPSRNQNFRNSSPSRFRNFSRSPSPRPQTRDNGSQSPSSARKSVSSNNMGELIQYLKQSLQLIDEQFKHDQRFSAEGSEKANYVNNDFSCYLCHEKGHMRRDCPRKDLNPQEAENDPSSRS